jgi:cell division protein FtsI/penicillin-binding protein 2
MMKRGKQKNINYIWRINLIKIGFFVLSFIFVYKLYNLQLLSGDYYRKIILKQVNYEEVLPRRGNIYFQDKNGKLISAATHKTSYIIAINPNLITNPQKIFEKISRFIKINKDDFFKKAENKGDPFEILTRGASEETAEQIKSSALSGVMVIGEDKRFYPAESLASHILGFVGYKDKEIGGRYGVEYFYDDILKGKKGVKANAFVLETAFNFAKKILDSPAEAKAGDDLILTVEPVVQAFLESALEKTLAKWEAAFPNALTASSPQKFSPLFQQIGGIIINPNNGAILAMAAKPDFNPNKYGQVRNFSLFMNPLIESMFEVGSVFKPLTLAAAIDRNALSASSTYFDKGYVFLNGERIENYDGKGRGLVDMQRVLNDSLNTGAVFAMQRLGKNDFKNYIKRYGFGEKTGVDLPNEAKGDISNLQSGRDIEYATASFGQGIAVTPIGFTAAVSSLANGGNLVKPHVVEKISYPFFPDRSANIKAKRRILRESTSETITRMLVKVVDEALLGGSRKMKNYSIAAKTGTAQMPKESGGYYKNRYLHSFFGYAPAFNPKFLIFLYFKNPQGVKYASHSLTDPFMDIMKFLLNYYEIPPDR